MTAYACREHPGQAVTWKGTGCSICDRVKQQPRRRRTDEWDASGAYPSEVER